MNFVRLTPVQMARALEASKITEANLRATLDAKQRELEVAVTRIGHLENVLKESAQLTDREAVNPPAPVVDSLDYVTFEDDVRETLEFYAGGGQDFGNRAAKILNDARRRAEAMLSASNESDTP